MYAISDSLKYTASYGIIVKNIMRKDMELFQSLSARNISLYLNRMKKCSRSVLNRGYFYE